MGGLGHEIWYIAYAPFENLANLGLKGLKTFGDFVNEYCKDIYKLPSINIDVVMDRYEGASIKDGVRNIRAKKTTKGKKKYKNKAVPKVISAEVPLPQGDDFKSFLGISENKIGFLLLLGKALIQNAPFD